MEQENKNMPQGDTSVQEAPRKKKKRIRIGAVIICMLYLALFVAFGVYLDKGLKWLEGWLTDYEAAQPNVKCQEVFEQLFADPDWAQLYTMAGMEDTQYESAEHYAAYMEAKVGTQQLQYSETSAGLSGDHKYIVKLGDEKVAEYTLTAQEHAVTDIPDWNLGTVSVFLTRQQDVTVCIAPDSRVYVNGVELTQEHTVGTMDTDVEEYLPEGLHGLRRRWVYADGFLLHPQVTVVNGAGENVSLIYDEATNTYTEPLPEMVMTQEQIDTVVNAAKTYCRYMVHDAYRGSLWSYFDKNSEIYNVIITNETWMLSFGSYRFEEPVLSGYYRYSDTLYSVKLNMSFFATNRRSGMEKEYPLDATFFVEQNDKGKWLVIDMINVDVQQQNTQVRLRYVLDGQVLEDQMVDTTATTLTPPAVTAPEGKQFAGWYLQKTDEQGNTTYSLAFAPDENGNVQLSEELGQQHMVLYALFDTQKAE